MNLDFSFNHPEFRAWLKTSGYRDKKKRLIKKHWRKFTGTGPYLSAVMEHLYAAVTYQLMETK